MQFLFPNFLWALGFLAIPIIIHLFYFRRFKKVQFTNVKFLKEIKEETSSRNKLKNLLVLLCRLLALGLLVLAFAQPFIPKTDHVDYSKKSVSVFVDNSFSMEALSSDVPLLDKAKKKAREIISAYTEADDFQIITHDFLGRHQRLVSKEDALNLIDEIEISPSTKKMSQIINRQAQVITKSDNSPVSYILSDFQKSITDLQNYKDTIFDINLVPLQDVQEKNVSIDSVWFTAPVPLLNQNNQLVLRVRNHGQDDVENIRITASHNGQEKPVGSMNIQAFSSKEDTINLSVLKPGWQELVIKITDYPVQFDDQFVLSFNVDDEMKVLSINENGSNKYMTAAFEGLNSFGLTNQGVNKVTYGDFVNYNLIILNDLNTISTGLGSELAKYVSDGGNLLIFPGSLVKRDNYNAFLNQLALDEIQQQSRDNRNVSKINTEEFIFDNVYLRSTRNVKLPNTTLNYVFSKFQSRGQEALLTYRDGSPFLMKYLLNNGNVYLCASPLNQKNNDLVANAEVFIPMLYKMGISSGKKKKTSYIIGQDHLVEVDRGSGNMDFNFEITGPNNFIPGQNNLGSKMILDTKDQIKSDGFYDLTLDKQLVSKLAFNYNRLESDLKYYSPSELEGNDNPSYKIIDNSVDANFTSVIGDRERGIVLWKWCLIFVLIFLLLETLLLRYWKL